MSVPLGNFVRALLKDENVYTGSHSKQNNSWDKILATTEQYTLLICLLPHKLTRSC